MFRPHNNVLITVLIGEMNSYPRHGAEEAEMRFYGKFGVDETTLDSQV